MGDFRVTHQVPVNRWSLFSHVLCSACFVFLAGFSFCDVRTDTLCENNDHLFGRPWPGGSITSGKNSRKSRQQKPPLAQGYYYEQTNKLGKYEGEIKNHNSAFQRARIKRKKNKWESNKSPLRVLKQAKKIFSYLLLSRGLMFIREP